MLRLTMGSLIKSHRLQLSTDQSVFRFLSFTVRRRIRQLGGFGLMTSEIISKMVTRYDTQQKLSNCQDLPLSCDREGTRLKSVAR